MKALITDVTGEHLAADERRFLHAAQPYGIILFARNCASPQQVRALINELKETLGRAHLPVLIDQEGGRVARLKPPQWRKSPAAGALAALAAHSVERAKEAIYLNARLMAQELLSHGITVNCAPVADLRAEGGHDIIGDRAYGDAPAQTALLAGEAARGLMEGGVVPVIKHIPGHGRAAADSHVELPVVNASLAALERTDFDVFKRLNYLPMGMTAHVIYPALDAKHMATVSPRVIRYIREEIGFGGLLMSDDITMKAMRGAPEQRAKEVLAAGCDIVLQCNAPLSEREAVAEATVEMSADATARSEAAFAAVACAPAPFDAAKAEARLAALMRV